MSDHKVNVTIKGAAGYDAPWVTIGGDTPDEVLNALRFFTGTQTSDVAELAVEAAVKFQNLWAVKDKLGGVPFPQSQGFTPTQQANVQQAQQAATAPIGPATQYITGQQAAPQVPQQQAATPPGPSCQHGPMTFRSGNKNGKAWSAYFCPTPKGTPGQCPPVWGK